MPASDCIDLDPGPENAAISGSWSRDEFETQHVAVRPRMRPNDLRVLDGGVVRCCPNAKRADMADGHAHVDGDPQAAHARVERQARATDRTEQVDLGIERPTAGPSTRTSMERNVAAAFRQD